MPYNVITIDSFDVLKDKEEQEDDEEEEQEEDYNSDTTEVAYSSDEEENPCSNHVCKRTTGFLVFASENKKDKTDLSIMNLGSPSSKVDLDLMTQLGERWKALSEEEHTNYAIKAELINNHYDEFVDVELD
jgi:hypothetical protein